MSKPSPATLAFVGFAVLLALRDILLEVYIEEDGLDFAFFLTSTVFILSLCALVAQRRLGALRERLKNRRILGMTALLGFFGALTYGPAFLLIADARVGAGLYNVVDSGVSPIAMSLVGVYFLKGSIRLSFFPALLVYLVGIFFLAQDLEPGTLPLLIVAMLIPFAVAGSDAVTRWMLKEGGEELDKLEVMVLRFGPSAVFLGIAAALTGSEGVVINNPISVLWVSVLCGFFPLWLLCTGLGKQGLTQLAAFEFVIPGLAYLGTLPWRPDNLGALRLLGASLAIIALLVSQSDRLDNWMHKKLGIPFPENKEE